MIDFPEITGFSEDLTTELDVLAGSQVRDVRSGLVDFSVKKPSMEVIQETYPRIYVQIKLMWGSQELQDTFTRWLLTDQDDRMGWPVKVYDALMEVSNAHAICYGLEGEPKWGLKRDRW